MSQAEWNAVGRSAFPVSLEDGTDAAEYGMSLRDYLAAHAKPETDIDGGIPARRARIVMSGPPPSQQPLEDTQAYDLRNLRWWIEADARVRYMHADAMLKVRGLKL